MRENIRKQNMGGVLALLLFGIFAVCILSVLLMSADAYQKMVRRDADSYDRRTAVQYISMRVRQGDRAGGISVRSADGIDMLVLTENIDGTDYETSVYCYDGYLRELFTAAGSDSAPEDGEIVLEAEDFQADLDGDRLSVRLLAPDGSWDAVLLHVRSGEEAAL